MYWRRGQSQTVSVLRYLETEPRLGVKLYAETPAAVDTQWLQALHCSVFSRAGSVQIIIAFIDNQPS